MTVFDYADIKRDEDFHEKYLRVDPSMVDSSDEFSAFYKENIDPTWEHDLYEPILNILARVSLHVAGQINIGDDGDRILFQPSHLHAVEDERDATVNKPDLVAVWDKLSAGEDVIRDKSTRVPTSKTRRTTELVSFVDVELLNPELSDRAAVYARGLPRERPDIAGLLYMTCTAEIFRFCWSDASRLVYSKQYEWEKDVHLLFYFLHTLYDAVDDLPQRDSTMQLSKEENGKLVWTVKTANREMDAVRLFSTPAWGKQTWILQSGSYIIKDLWREKKMRFTEGAVLEKIHEEGYVPGVVRLGSYEEVAVTKADGSPQELETSRKHSGVIFCGTSNLLWQYKDVPDNSSSGTKRIEYEAVTHGGEDANDGNSTIESVQPHHEEIESGEAADDVEAGGAPDDGESEVEDDYASQVHEQKIPQRVKVKAILESYGDALEECTSLLQLLKIGFDIVHIHQFCVMDRDSLHRDISKSNIVINPKHKPDDTKKQNPKVMNENVKEIAMLIDWDNAALLGSGAPLTDMTGTPMYIAMAVSVGAFYFSEFQTRANFSLISDEARALYIGAYGQKKHDDYINEINKSPFIVEPEEEVPFEHLPYLDMESVFWLYAYILCRACVGDEDKSTYEYDRFTKVMEHHNPGYCMDDSRDLFIILTELEKWEKRLHPKLRLVAGMSHRMAQYLRKQWAYSKDDIPADHAHEMMKRLFLDEIVHVRKEGEVTINLKKTRGRWKDPASARKSLYGTHVTGSGDVLGVAQSNDNLGPVSGNVPQDQSRSSVGEKRRREDDNVG
ncbi:hypothetical protein DFH11DRAFT_1547833 [Phellopilus nigrolimitatus]|nr:hypothetical protein DFH11DRAFT_1547833 [Phellopilus nigrolimitatus]